MVSSKGQSVGLMLVLVAAALGCWTAGGEPRPAAVGAGGELEANKSVVRRFYAAVNGGDLDALDELVSEDYQTHPPLPGQPPGRDGLKYILGVFATGFPDVQLTVEDMIAEGDRVAARWTARGTHNGPFFGVPPTGRQAQFGGTDIFRVEGGKLVEAWHIEELLSILIQIGAVPAPGQ
jgi:steroid delta-isomerase-like uncharacterized protein